MKALHELSLTEASAGIARRRFSPVEYLDALQQRAETVGGKVNAIVRPLWDEAREQAVKAGRRIARSGPRSALDGLPVGLKDIIDIAGHPTTCHSRILLDNQKSADAAVVARLRAAGAIFPAKLATHEFAIGGPAFDLPFPPARNLPAAPPPAPGFRSPMAWPMARWARIPAAPAASLPR